MPVVPSNSKSGASLGAARAFTVSPSSMPSFRAASSGAPGAAAAMGSALAAGMRPIETAIGIEERRRRDDENRHLRHMKEARQLIGQAVETADVIDRALDRRAQVQAQRELSTALKAASERAEYIDADGNLAGTLHEPYSPGDEANPQGTGPLQATTAMIDELRKGMNERASGRMMRIYEDKFDRVFGGLLNQAERANVAANMKWKKDGAAIAAEASERFFSMLDENSVMDADNPSQYQHGFAAALVDAARKRATLGVISDFSVFPSNGDFDDPQWADEKTKGVYEARLKDQIGALTLEKGKQLLAKMSAQDSDAEADRIGAVAEALGAGLEGDAATAFDKAAEAAVAHRRTRLERQERERMEQCGDLLAEMMTGGDGAWSAKGEELGRQMQRLTPSDRLAVQNRLEQAEYVRELGPFESALEQALADSPPDADRAAIARGFRERAEAISNPKAKLAARAMIARLEGETFDADARAEKLARAAQKEYADRIGNTIELGVCFARDADGAWSPKVMSRRDVADAIQAALESGRITPAQADSLARRNRERDGSSWAGIAPGAVKECFAALEGLVGADWCAGAFSVDSDYSRVGVGKKPGGKTGIGVWRPKTGAFASGDPWWDQYGRQEKLVADADGRLAEAFTGLVRTAARLQQDGWFEAHGTSAREWMRKSLVENGAYKAKSAADMANAVNDYWRRQEETELLARANALRAEKPTLEFGGEE